MARLHRDYPFGSAPSRGSSPAPSDTPSVQSDRISHLSWETCRAESAISELESHPGPQHMPRAKMPSRLTTNGIAALRVPPQSRTTASNGERRVYSPLQSQSPPPTPRNATKAPALNGHTAHSRRAATSLQHQAPAPHTQPNTSAPRLLFHCRACSRDPCVEPVTTLCGHVFCTRCAVSSAILSGKTMTDAVGRTGSCILQAFERAGFGPVCQKVFIVAMHLEE